MNTDYKIIANPTAGRGKASAIIRQVKELLKERGENFEIILTNAPGEATDLAKRYAEEGWPVVVALGGDGTVSEVICGLANTSSKLGIISCGTGNDIARSLGIPVNIHQGVAVLLNGKGRRIDLGLERDQIFANIAGVGFSCDVTERANAMKKLKGSLSFLAATYKTLSSLKSIQARIEMDNEVIEEKITSITISNMKYAGGGMVFAPDAVPDDGLFDVSIVREIGKISLALTFPQMYRDEGVKHPAMSRHRSSFVNVYLDQPMSKMFDGNIIGKTPLEAKIIPKALEFIVPDQGCNV